MDESMEYLPLSRDSSRYEYTIPDYEQKPDPYNRTWILLEWTGRGKRVLELGCSTGAMSQYLVQRRGCSVIGVELDSQAAAQAKRFCEDVLIEDLNDFNWTARLSKGEFDVILMGDVLEHLANPNAVLTQMRPLLGDDGRVVISLPNVVHWHTRLKILFGRFHYESFGILDHTHLRFYTPKTARRMIETSGYKITRFHPVFGGRLSRHSRPVSQWLAHLSPGLFAYQMLFEARKNSSGKT
jgi:2-polyprenyl-3-methyl-5-hydroxy-6-metoxy-1,4-benzoquinol methylase